MVIVAAGLACVLSGCRGERNGRPPGRREIGQLGRAIAAAPARTTQVVTVAPPVAHMSADTGGGRCGAWIPNRGGHSLAGCRATRWLLTAAGRFAEAYVRYQTAQLTGSVKADLRATSTAAFAGFLLSQPVSVPPGQHIARERVTRVILTSGSKVNASWVAQNPPSGQPQSGTVQITLTRAHGRWLVAAAKPLL
jgi:hypothetical protein